MRGMWDLRLACPEEALKLRIEVGWSLRSHSVYPESQLVDILMEVVDRVGPNGFATGKEVAAFAAVVYADLRRGIDTVSGYLQDIMQSTRPEPVPAAEPPTPAAGPPTEPGEQDGRVAPMGATRFPCPRCGGRMFVQETRSNARGIRRRRVCLDQAGCTGRVTTLEIAMRVGTADDTPGPPMGDLVLVSRHDWEELSALTARVVSSIQTQLDYPIERVTATKEPADAPSEDPDPTPARVPAGPEQSTP
jgi:hypothetical protein